MADPQAQREQDIETIAVGMYTAGAAPTDPPWGRQTERGRATWLHLAAAAHAALTAAGRLVPVAPPDRGHHIIDIYEGGWTLAHPLACRQTGLFECPVNQAARRALGPDSELIPAAGLGRYRIDLEAGAGGRLRIGGREDG